MISDDLVIVTTTETCNFVQSAHALLQLRRLCNVWVLTGSACCSSYPKSNLYIDFEHHFRISYNMCSLHSKVDLHVEAMCRLSRCKSSHYLLAGHVISWRFVIVYLSAAKTGALKAWHVLLLAAALVARYDRPSASQAAASG